MAFIINHVAIWTQHLEELKDFYVKYFEGQCNEKYVNSKNGFESYFITFSSGARLELMKSINIRSTFLKAGILPGYAHIAFSLGSKEAVDAHTENFTKSGYQVVDGPRTTGDGYYESVIKDPDGNLVELTI